MNKSNLDGEHTAVHHCQTAGRYFAMAWAAGSEMWAELGMKSLTEAARALGYTLTPIAHPTPAVTMVAEDDRPVTFATTEEGRR